MSEEGVREDRGGHLQRIEQRRGWSCGWSSTRSSALARFWRCSYRSATLTMQGPLFGLPSLEFPYLLHFQSVMLGMLFRKSASGKCAQEQAGHSISRLSAKGVGRYGLLTLPLAVTVQEMHNPLHNPAQLCFSAARISPHHQFRDQKLETNSNHRCWRGKKWRSNFEIPSWSVAKIRHQDISPCHRPHTTYEVDLGIPDVPPGNFFSSVRPSFLSFIDRGP